MPPMLTKSRISTALSLAAYLLCVAVFAGCLQARLSLYKAPTPSHLISIVKVIQDDQANEKVGSSRPCDRCSSCQLTLQDAVGAHHPPFIIRRSRQVRRQAFAAIQSYPHALFFKPPPAGT